MVQSITPDLTDLLVSKLQAGTSGFRGEIEIDVNHLEGSPIDTSAVASGSLACRYPFDDSIGSGVAVDAVAGHNGTAEGDATYNGCSLDVSGSDLSTFRSSSNAALAPNTAGTLMAWASWPDAESGLLRDQSGIPTPFGHGSGWMLIGRRDGGTLLNEVEYRVGGTTIHTGLSLSFLSSRLTHYAIAWDATGSALYINGAKVYAGPAPGASPIVLPWVYGKNGEISTAGSYLPGRIADMRIFNSRLSDADVAEIADGGSPCDDPELVTVTYSLVPASIAVDRSRSMAAAQLDAAFTNEANEKGWYSGSAIIQPNNPIRAYAWYGDVANRVRIFTGLIDRPHEGRDPRTVDVKARSRMKWLLEQKFLATASQSVDDATAVRTEDNGVYLGKSPEYIVGDILDRAGWPSADRALGTSGVTIDEYDLADGSSWAEQIAGPDRLTTTAGFDFWEDELGVVHFAANALADVSEPDPDYTFQVGVDVLRLDHETDDEDRATRVRVSGPMTSAVPSWSVDWSMTSLSHPVGVMSLAGDATYVYVVDRVTGYLYKVRLADRVVVTKWHIGSSLTYQPLGLSKDPSDATIFWVLEGMWIDGANTHAKVAKVRLSDKVLLAEYSLPDGSWSDLKSDGSNLWLTNYGDDKLYKRSLTATAVASYSYAGETNPTGMFLTGTTIGVFFNGGDAFHLVDTSAPGTITGTLSTSGTHIEGGEIDQADSTALYATNEAGDFGATAGHVWKATLATLVTADVVKWAYDQDLEDALGVQSGIADRIHDLHSGDAAHPFEIRPATYAMNVVNSEAQAQAVADAELVLLSRIRRVMDLGTLGNPAVQINDVIRYIDPVANIDAVWLLDSYRAQLDAAGTYTTTMSLLPWVAP